eukprot:3803762-Rhodomonas_salina.1
MQEWRRSDSKGSEYCFVAVAGALDGGVEVSDRYSAPPTPDHCGQNMLATLSRSLCSSLFSLVPGPRYSFSESLLRLHSCLSALSSLSSLFALSTFDSPLSES